MCYRYYRYYVVLIGILVRICFVLYYCLLFKWLIFEYIFNNNIYMIGGWVGMFMGCGVLLKF